LQIDHASEAILDFLSKLREKFRFRKLQVDIMTVFLMLLTLTSTFIITFTHSRTIKSILEFSKTEIQNEAQIVVEKVDCFINEFTLIPQTANSLISNRSDVVLENHSLMAYVKQLVKVHPNLYAYYFGTNDGFLIEIINLKIAHQNTFHTNIDTPLPQNALYAIRYVDRQNDQVTANWFYFDHDLNQVADEVIPNYDFDPRKRPWYQDAYTTKDTVWTDVYTYDPYKEPGITVAQACYSQDGELIGVSGADLSLTSFSDFLLKQKVGKTGEALILKNSTGSILLPLENDGQEPSKAKLSIIQEAYREYKSSSEKDIVFKHHDQEFLAAINPFPLGQATSWLIVVLAPLSDFFGKILETQKIVVIISMVAFFIAGIFVYLFSKRISTPISILAEEIDKIKKLNLDSNIKVQSNIKEINILNSSIEAMRKAIRSFSKYVPKEIVRQLIKNDKEIELGGDKKDIVVMFCDIANFTPIAEKLSADELMPLLEEYFDKMSKIILSNQGTIDKYIGDSIMAFWGAPEVVTKPCTQACLAILKCQALLKAFNQDRKAKNLPEFPTRFGMDAGLAFVGNIGTHDRINYTAIGDIVNSASRLQSINKTYKTSITISESIYTQIKDEFLTRPIDLATVKGKETKIKIYELLALNSEDPEIGITPDLMKLADEFTKAYELYQNGQKDQALETFKRIHEMFPQDELTLYYIQKLESLN
jgi:adenylate cyclase